MGKFLVMQVHNSDHREFIGFDSYAQFKACYDRTPSSFRTLSEVVRDGPQRFRIDIDNDKPIDVHKAASCLLRFLLQEGVPDPSIIVCGNVVLDRSISDRGYHMILASPALPNASAVSWLAQRFVDYAQHEPWVTYVDLGVYKKVQCFRILGSTKYRSQRWKAQLFTYPCGTDEAIKLPFDTALVSSLCGCLDAGIPVWNANMQACQADINPWSSVNRIALRSFAHTPVSSSLAQALSRIGAFRVRSVQGTLVILDTLRPYHCPNCQRTHSSENPYLVVRGETATFHCRRRPLALMQETCASWGRLR